MEKIVHGICLKGEYVENCWDVRTWVSNGVTERSARQVIEWTEEYPYTPPLPWDEYIAQYDYDPAKQARLELERLEEIEEKRLKSLKASARRAKTLCRRFIISEGFDEMLTLTYRDCQPDRDLCKKHFSIWSKRMKRAIGTFRYCASFEVQERGSMHVHCATHKLPMLANYKGVKIKAWQLGTKIWRDVVGGNNGMCFVGASPSKFGHARRKNMTLAKMANYVSKYILKDFELAPEESNRYSRSNGQVLAQIYTMRLNGSLPEIIAACFEVNDGDVMVSHHVSRFNDSWWLCTERGIGGVAATLHVTN